MGRIMDRLNGGPAKTVVEALGKLRATDETLSAARRVVLDVSCAVSGWGGVYTLGLNFDRLL